MPSTHSSGRFSRNQLTTSSRTLIRRRTLLDRPVNFPWKDLAVTEFDTDTALSPKGDGVFEGTVTDRWMIGGGPNGGYIASFLMRAFTAVSPQPDALSITTH